MNFVIQKWALFTQKQQPEESGSMETIMKKTGTSEGRKVFKNRRTEEVGFDHLPDELVSKIFSNLSTSDLLTKVARVSKRFHRLSQDSDAHIAVQIPDLYKCKRTKVVPLRKFLRGKKNIQEVKMLSHSVWNQLAFKYAVMDQKKTTSLGAAIYVFADAFKQLVENPQKARQIRKLNLQGDYSDCLSSVIPEFVNLIKFVLKFDLRFGQTDAEFANFAFSIAMKSEKLESFSCEPPLETHQLEQLLDRHGSRLKKLCLPDTALPKSIEERISNLKIQARFKQDDVPYVNDDSDQDDQDDEDDNDDDEVDEGDDGDEDDEGDDAYEDFDIDEDDDDDDDSDDNQDDNDDDQDDDQNDNVDEDWSWIQASPLLQPDFSLVVSKLL